MNTGSILGIALGSGTIIAVAWCAAKLIAAALTYAGDDLSDQVPYGDHIKLPNGFHPATVSEGLQHDHA